MMTHVPWPKGEINSVEIISSQESKTLSSDPKEICKGNIREIVQMLMDSKEKTGWKTDEINQIYKDTDYRFSRPANAIFTAQDVIEISKEMLPKDGLLFTETGAFIALLENTWKFDEPLKFTAKLRQYKTDNNLLLLKCELEDAGHGGKSGRDSAIEEIAFDYSFIFKITNKLNN